MEPVGGGGGRRGSSSADPRSTFVLSNLAEVVERVFTFLPAKALLRVAGVCRLWRECVRRALRTHRGVTWISAGPAEAGHAEGHCLVRALARELEASKAGCPGFVWRGPRARLAPGGARVCARPALGRGPG